MKLEGSEQSASRTSYGIKWKRADPRPRPDYRESPTAELFVSEGGEPLFWVTTVGGSSEGIFTLINEAPRLRDELDSIVASEIDRCSS